MTSSRHATAALHAGSTSRRGIIRGSTRPIILTDNLALDGATVRGGAGFVAGGCTPRYLFVSGGASSLCCIFEVAFKTRTV